MATLRQRLERLERRQRELEARLVEPPRPPTPEEHLAEIARVAHAVIRRDVTDSLETCSRLILLNTLWDYEEACGAADEARRMPPRDYHPELSRKLRIRRWRCWDSEEIRPFCDRLEADYRAVLEAWESAEGGLPVPTPGRKPKAPRA